MKTALPALIAAAAAVCISIGATAQMTPREPLVFVEHGRPLNVGFSTTPWTTQDDALTGAGNDNWVLANRGIEEGDFHITARLTIRSLAKSAARFSFNQQYAFGFEGNHQHVYITKDAPGHQATAWISEEPETTPAQSKEH
jgi:hypothetical protein